MSTNEKEINKILKLQWSTGAKALSKQMEQTIRAKPGINSLKLWSCACEEWLDKLITVHPKMLSLKEEVQLLQCENDPVLIVGETGTGKELIARALHGSRTGKFMSINCTAMPSELIESELFGHVKGAFTGAVSDRHGKFKAAYGGTVFLDEIGDMPVDMQSKLLRVLQERKCTPVGSNDEEDINCRVVAATNKTIKELIESVHFRTDLFYRLSVFILQTIPLAERPDDIRHIVDSLGGEDMPDDTAWLIEGNVRSLQAQVRRFKVLGK